MSLLAKACAFALVLYSPASVSLPAFAAPVTIMVAPYHYPLVKQVVCDNGLGTAFRVGPTTLLSVAHVTDNVGCTVDGTPFTHVADEGKDFAVIETPIVKLGAIKINCDGFKPGGWYYATGFARGLPWQRTILLRASYIKDNEGRHILFGPDMVAPGMSGGPIVNAAGEAVGTINAYIPMFGMSVSQPLSTTSVCKGKAIA